MAKSARDLHSGMYLTNTMLRGRNVERMSPRARRAYLQRHLRLIDAQIRILSDRLDESKVLPGSGWSWAQESVDGEWLASLASLNYLFAVRAALRTAIDRL